MPDPFSKNPSKPLSGDENVIIGYDGEQISKVDAEALAAVIRAEVLATKIQNGVHSLSSIQAFTPIY